MSGPAGLPEVTVVIAARDAAATIEDQLDALSAQTFDGDWELIVVDDGSTDGTVAARWTHRVPSLLILSLAEPRGVSHGRNIGTEAARGPLVAYCDADDVVSTRWLAGLVSALTENAIATGPLDLSELNPHRIYGWRGASGWQRLPRWMGYLPEIGGGNMAVRREMFDVVGGLDEKLACGEDRDFVWRIQLEGGTVGFSREAVVHWRLRQGWSHFRRSLDYGLAQAELYRRFRHRGLRRRRMAEMLRLTAVMIGAPLFLVPKYRYGWMLLAGLELGRLRGSIVARTSPFVGRREITAAVIASNRGGGG